MAEPQWQTELKTKLATQGIDTHFAVKNGVLHLALKAVNLPLQNEVIPEIIAYLNQHSLPEVKSIKIYGQTWNDPFPVWEYEGKIGADFQPQSLALQPEKIPLWQRVQQGDSHAITTVLERVLAHRNIRVNVTQNQGVVRIELAGNDMPTQEVLVKLIAQELRRYKMPTVTPIQLTITQGEAIWEQEFALGDLLTIHPKTTPHSVTPTVTLPLHSIVDDRIRIILLIGAITGFILCTIPLIRFILSYLVIIIHELGHALAGWLMGYPSIPALDFIYGGGITLQLTERWALIPMIIYGVIGFLIYYFRRNRLTIITLSGLVFIYTLTYFTRLHQLFIIAMGHGLELIFISLFLYRALTGWGCQQPAEQTLYGVLGFFMFFYNLNFTRQLLFNSTMRELYLMGKGDVLDHDFVRIAREFLGVNLSLVVVLFTLCCLLTPLVSWALVRYQNYWLYGCVRLLRR